jgi:hypothetical protein
MNLRLVQTSQFLSQFSNLKIRHKLENYYLISDALSRLQSLNKKDLFDDHDDLDELFVEYTIFVIYVYNTILIKLNSKFRARIIERYFKNESWRKIIQIINQNETLNENAIDLFFMRKFDTISRESDSYMTSNMKSVSSFNEIQKNSRFLKSVSSFNEIQKNSKTSKSVSQFNETQKNSTSSKSFSRFNESQNNEQYKNLIYHVNRSTEEKRLCISSECVSNILTIAHERKQEHSNFEVTFEIISRSWYICDLIKTLRFYIRNCSQCL